MKKKMIVKVIMLKPDLISLDMIIIYFFFGTSYDLTFLDFLIYRIDLIMPFHPVMMYTE